MLQSEQTAQQSPSGGGGLVWIMCVFMDKEPRGCHNEGLEERDEISKVIISKTGGGGFTRVVRRSEAPIPQKSNYFTGKTLNR